MLFDAFVAGGDSAKGEQPVAEHLRWKQVVGLRVDIHRFGLSEQTRRPVDGCGVQQLPCIAQGRFVDGRVAFQNGLGIIVF